MKGILVAEVVLPRIFGLQSHFYYY